MGLSKEFCYPGEYFVHVVQARHTIGLWNEIKGFAGILNILLDIVEGGGFECV